MTKDEALKMALEALRMPSNYWNKTQFIKVNEAIAAAEEALAQPQQEPVQFKCTVIDDAHPNGIPLEQWAKPQRKPLTLGQKQRLWSSVGDKPTLKDRVNAYGLAIEAAHGIKENT